MSATFLIGFMAAGKSSVGRGLAAATGRVFVDLDDRIAAMGEPVASLVGRDEPEFRRREAAALQQVIEESRPAAGSPVDGPVVATGGGCAAFGDNLARMKASGVVIALDVDVAEAKRRAGDASGRPLLANAEALAVKRAPIYRRAHAVVATGGKPIGAVVAEVRAVEDCARKHPGATFVSLFDRTYPVIVDDGPPLLRTQGTRVAVITDDNVARHWPDIAAHDIRIAIPPGEATKTFATYERLCNELIAAGLDRGSTIVAVGGGVVGDLAGFVAATLFRGIRVVQVPTTIVAMTDAAIGGKTAIDLPAGKNLVGAFHQPAAVHCFTQTLRTLPARERRAGFGELWKYALLDGPDLWQQVAACAAWAAGPDDAPPPAAFREVIERSIAYKAAVVGADEREKTGVRALLNLGHTVGHAIESASGMLHGEAVGLGLVASCRVSAALGLARPALEREVTAALTSSGLAADLSPYLHDDVLARIAVDKKRVGNFLKFIAVREVGACEPVEIAVTDLVEILRRPTTP